MKTLIRKPRWFLIAALLFIAAMACNKDDDVPVDTTDYGVINVASMQTKVDALPPESLNDDELNSLTIMREEEKLARDVYQVLSTKYNAKIFSNIALAEQTHMDAVLILLNKYDMEDPVGANPVGVFTDPILQFLYDELIAVGNTGILNAYKVGATIEDMDIYDLRTIKLTVDNKDILLVYDNLEKGSRNHLRSFYGDILKAGGTYTPEFLTQAEFDAIVNSPMETGF